MGIDYTAGVMFGAFAKGGSPAEKKLTSIYEEFEERDGDVNVNVSGVSSASVVRRGNSMSGDFWYAVQVGQSHSMTSRGGGYSGPFKIEPGQSDEVTKAIVALGLDPSEFTEVGFFTFQDVW